MITKCCTQDCRQGRDCPLRNATQPESAKQKLPSSEDFRQLAQALVPADQPTVMDLVARCAKSIQEQSAIATHVGKGE